MDAQQKKPRAGKRTKLTGDPQIDARVRVILTNHDVLLSTLPISHGSILRSLHERGVITATTLREIRIEPLSRTKVRMLLDGVILKDLVRAGIVDSFDKLIEVLQGSQDPVAEKLGKGLRDGIIESDEQLQRQEKIEYSKLLL